MITQTADISRIVYLRINTDEDILEALSRTVQEHNIRQGMIVNGIGSAKTYHVHVVETTNVPPGDIFFRGEGAYDILSLTGLVLNGRVHAHITLADTEKAIGGHLEPGTKALTFCLVTIAETPEADLTDWDDFRKNWK